MSAAKINEGDLLGACPTCGLVPEELIDLQFPVTTTCRDCGQELTEVIVAPCEATVEEIGGGKAKFEVRP